jgi:hypothetical protein
MSIRTMIVIGVAGLVMTTGATADAVPRLASDAVACFQLSGFAKASVEPYGAMATEVDVHWATTNSLDAWLTSSPTAAQSLFLKTRAGKGDPGLTHVSGRWVYTWAKWPAPMIQSAPRRCLRA